MWISRYEYCDYPFCTRIGDDNVSINDLHNLFSTLLQFKRKEHNGFKNCTQ